MTELRYTLVADGNSDRAFLALLKWLLRRHGVKHPLNEQLPNHWPSPPSSPKLVNRIPWALEQYPCDLLFVHRDAENQDPAKRRDEIHAAITKLPGVPPTVCVVPVRMKEAWLLFDESAIRRAAGNPNGTQPITLPDIGRVEQLPDPKNRLYEILREASGLPVYRRKKFRAAQNAPRISDFIEDFTPLRALPAFRALEADVERVVKEQGWDR